jgi:hypothetical protein
MTYTVVAVVVPVTDALKVTLLGKSIWGTVPVTGFGPTVIVSG